MKIIKDKKKVLEIKAAQIISFKIRKLLKTQDNVILGIPGGRSVRGIFELLKKQRIKPKFRLKTVWPIILLKAQKMA